MRIAVGKNEKSSLRTITAIQTVTAATTTVVITAVVEVVAAVVHTLELAEGRKKNNNKFCF